MRDVPKHMLPKPVLLKQNFQLSGHIPSYALHH
ncbi:MAG: hypothetical protein JWM44_1022, partial [Bacilli bacterium]|nr:hypothetical protein [Bacilli bacterium]